jgi:hypothetical protein
VVVVLVLGTAMHQILVDRAQEAQVLPAQELAEEVPHSLFKVTQVVQTLEIPELGVDIMVLQAAMAAFILGRVNIPQVVAAVPAGQAA